MGLFIVILAMYTVECNSILEGFGAISFRQQWGTR